MNEKLQYATMLEIPVNTCNVTFKQPKRRKTKRRRKQNLEEVKEQLLTKINDEQFGETIAPVEISEQALLDSETITDNQIEVTADEQGSLVSDEENIEELTAQVHVAEKLKKRYRFKFSVIGAQLAIIGVLIATIFLTNAFYADSGINVFLRSVFGGGQTQVAVDSRKFDEFTPVIAMDGEYTLENGVTSFVGEGSVYSPCDGKISSVVKGEDGKFIIEITHSTNFKSVLSGIDYAYAGVDDIVYGNIPVGYVRSGATMCFTDSDGSVISNYQINDNTVIWAV